MSSEIEITETPNWLKELEAKRERRLKTKLGHELGAGAPCLTCEEKCPGLDLHFWRKICKNCKCSKENHEVQDDDIYGWAQDELLGTKVNRLKRKIVLPGRKEEVELEWTPNGQKETIDKYLKTLPPEQLPIKGSQAAQDRKQLLKKQIPIHDIDPTLCHELSEEELKKMQEYIAHIKQSSAGVGRLIQINFGKGTTHVMDKNDAMFLINNVPKGIVSSENVILQGGNNSSPLKNLSNKFGSLDLEDSLRLSLQEPNSLVSNSIDNQNPIYMNIRNKHYNDDNLSRTNANNVRTGQLNVYGAQGNKILTEDVQVPQDITLKNLNFSENIYKNIPKSTKNSFNQDNIQSNPAISGSVHSLFPNSNIKNLVPSAFVPIKFPNEDFVSDETSYSARLSEGNIKELPYPSQFINDRLNFDRNLPNYAPEAFNTFNEHQNPAFFQPIKDVRYSPSHNLDRPMQHPQDTQLSNTGNSELVNGLHNVRGSGLNTNVRHSPSYNVDHTRHYPQESQTLKLNDRQMSKSPYRTNEGIDRGANQGGNYFPHLSNTSSSNVSNSAYPTEEGSLKDPSKLSGAYKIKDDLNPDEKTALGRHNQTNSPLLHSNLGKISVYEDQQKPKIRSIKDLAYSTFDSLPEAIQDDDFHNLSVKDRLNMIKKGQLPTFRPSNSPISDNNVSPSKFSTRDHTMSHDNRPLDREFNSSGTRDNQTNVEGLSPQNSYRSSLKSPFIQSAQSEDVGSRSPGLSRNFDPLNKQNYGTPSLRNICENKLCDKERYTEGSGRPSSGRYADLPSYAPGSKDIYEDDYQPKLISVGGIRDIEYEDPEIRTALSKDNELFEGCAPNKFLPNIHSGILPCCHYCEEKFKQDELAIAIPERSDAIFHTHCFKCHGCNQILADMFYFYDKETDNVYCGRDYAKIRGIPRCRACDELIFVKEYCLAENSTFHVKHFCCFECDKPLAGQNYVMENDQPVCVPCYELTKANKCYACNDVIHPDQQGLQLKDGVHFHATDDCFACKVCKKSLFGAKLLFRKDCLYCSHDCYNSDV